MYNKFIKRAIDLMVASIALILLAVPMLFVSVFILIDDPGKIFFKQKRIGIKKTYFMCYKFRSMKMVTPHDVPTHMLQHPEDYITKFGKFMRKMSIDELPQLFNIIRGDMTFVGPRPALWNQEDLIFERDKYGANDVRPGLTGLAQINGRDTLEIAEKAKMDGIYTQLLKKGGWSAFWIDFKCFIGTFSSVISHKDVIEGGIRKQNDKSVCCKEAANYDKDSYNGRKQLYRDII